MLILALIVIAGAILAYIYRHRIANLLKQFEPVEVQLRREWDAINRVMEEIKQKGSASNLNTATVEELEKALETWVINYKRLIEISQLMPELHVNPDYVKAADALNEVFKD